MVASARLEATQDSFFRNQPEKLVSRSIILGTILNWKPIFLLLNNEQRERWGKYFIVTIMLMFDDLSIMIVNDLSLEDDITYKNWWLNPVEKPVQSLKRSNWKNRRAYWPVHRWTNRSGLVLKHWVGVLLIIQDKVINRKPTFSLKNNKQGEMWHIKLTYCTAPRRYLN